MSVVRGLTDFKTNNVYTSLNVAYYIVFEYFKLNVDPPRTLSVDIYVKLMEINYRTIIDSQRSKAFHHLEY